MPREIVAGRYEIVRLIAEGGMGSVYEARHVVTEQPVALKRLHARFAADEDARKRFLREMRAPAKIRHPGVCTIFDAGFEDGEPYIVMELLDGETLGDRLRRGVSIDEGLDLVERLLEPLAAAHASGVVHRDLKPENLFVAKDGEGERVKLLDFGIARRATEAASLTATGTAIGTPHYMSPEQAINSKTVDAATDVWAVGVMLYEVLSGGARPFDGEDAFAVIARTAAQPHASLGRVAPSTLPALQALVDQCLEKSPAARPRDAAELLRALKRARTRLAPTVKLDPRVVAAVAKGAPRKRAASRPAAQQDAPPEQGPSPAPAVIQPARIAIGIVIGATIVTAGWLGLSWGTAEQAATSGPGPRAEEALPGLALDQAHIWATGIAAGPDGDLYAAEPYFDRIRVIRRGRVEVLAGNGVRGHRDGEARSAHFDGPTSVAVGSDGAVYVHDNERIRVIRNGRVDTLIHHELLATSSLWNPGFVLGPRGELYVSHPRERRVMVVREGQLSTHADLTEVLSPDDSWRNRNALAIGADGTVFAANDRRIVALQEGSRVELVVESDLIMGGAIAWTAPGTLIDASFRRVYQVIGGRVTTLVDREVMRDHSSISSVAVAGDGIIYLASDIGEHRILSVRRSQLSVYAGVGVAGNQDGLTERARFDEPGDLVVAADGSIYVLDQRVPRRLRVISRRPGRHAPVAVASRTGSHGTCS